MLKGGIVRQEPAGGKAHAAGSEKKADMAGAFESKLGRQAPVKGSVGNTKLGAATGELRSQHPHHHSAGAVHGTKDHVRHKV